MVPSEHCESRTTVIRTEVELAALKDDWNRLYQQNASYGGIFLTYEWAEAAWRTFSAGRKLWVVVVRDRSGAAICIAPLVKRSSLNFTVLEFLSSPLADYADFLTMSGQDLPIKDSLDFLRRDPDWDVLELRGITDGSALGRLPAEYWTEKGWILHQDQYSAAPYISIQTGFEEYLRSVGRKLVSDTKRQIRRLEEEGPVVLFRCATSEQALMLLEMFAKQKATRYITTGARNLFRDERILRFFMELVRTLWSNGNIDMTSLRVGEKVVALHFGFREREKYQYYMPSFDLAYANKSAGRVHLYFLLKDCFARGFEEFDFLSGEDAYKSQWTKTKRALSRVTVYRPSARGRTLHFIQRRVFENIRSAVISKRFARLFRLAVQRMAKSV